MIIQIDETNTLNKGAELMFFAIIEELEKRKLSSKVIFNSSTPHLPSNNSNLNLVERRKQLGYLYSSIIAPGLNKFNLPNAFFTTKFKVDNVDVVIDAGGFQFSDQWKPTQNYLNLINNYYGKLKSQNPKSKLIFLPQALGPFETKNGKKIVEILDKYADLIIAREQVSFDYIEKHLVNKSKLKCFPDFTLKVLGEIPEKYKHLKDKVCIIPNRKMVTHTNASIEQYVNFYKVIINELKNRNKDVFLLNHEGKGDLKICNTIRQKIDPNIEIVTNINAKEVKGVISQSALVISSRFHGVASSLSSAVPCLSTSWSHKYKMLFQDFGQTDMIFNLDSDEEQIKEKIEFVFSNEEKIQDTLKTKKEELLVKIESMWDLVENTIKNN